MMTLVDALRREDDVDFDLVYPDWVRRLSARFWTPVTVAMRAAELLVGGDDGCRVLDVGAGPGKFCLVGALTTGAAFYGIEQRPGLVDIARETARAHGVRRVTFAAGNMTRLNWAEFDGFYLFNPFTEHRAPRGWQIDDSIKLRPHYTSRYVRAVFDKLRDTRRGARVVTYHGFGGEMPPEYSLQVRQLIGTDALELWVNDGGAGRSAASA